MHREPKPAARARQSNDTGEELVVEKKKRVFAPSDRLTRPTKRQCSAKGERRRSKPPLKAATSAELTSWRGEPVGSRN